MELSLAVNRQGPLSERERRLVRLGVAMGQQSEHAVRAQVQRALEEGFTADEVRHAALLALTTAGFAAMIAALAWIEEELVASGDIEERVAERERSPGKGRGSRREED